MITKYAWHIKMRVVTLLAVAVLCTSRAAAEPVSLYVSPQGNDSWSGKLESPNQAGTDGPFATLSAARQAIRTLKKAVELPAGGVTVWIQPGDYSLEQSFELTAEDSGTAESPIVYRATRTQSVRLIGGREVRSWRRVEDAAILSRLDPPARDYVRQADLKAIGITNFGRLRSRGFGRGVVPAGLELFFGGYPMTLARWPNGDFTKIVGYPEAVGDEHGGKLGPLTGGFNYEGDRPSRWRNTSDIWIHGYWAYDWANSYEHIASLDLDKRLIKTSPPHGHYGFRAGGHGGRFFFLNILEELDTPGEWYIDRTSGTLYFWPPQAVEQAPAMVSVIEEPVIHLNGASHITIQGLTIECARGTGIRIKGGGNNRVLDCTLGNLGNYGIEIDGGANHKVGGCTIYETGDGGVSVSGGDRKTLAAAGHVVENNHIHHIARWSRCYAPAILISGVGVRASNNLIHDHPHCAILFNGNEHVIERNEIHHVCLETGDVGAIYTGRDYTYRGNVIRHNFIHHTGGVGMGSMGIYMDDCVSGTLIYGNVLWKLHRAVFLGGGRDFRVENNIFVDCDPAVELDGRGLSKSAVWHDMVYKTMRQRLEEMNWRQPPYSTRYPELTALEPHYAKDDGVPPGNVLVARNICVGSKLLNITWGAKPEMAESRDNLTDADPLFVDAAKGDFRLKPDSPAFKLGFEPIPFDKIGPMTAADDVYVTRGNERSLETIQKAYAQMPPVQYTPPTDRWEHLPRTKERLLNGGVLRVVMLGDSIVNDTSRSGWDLIVQRRHPKCTIEKVTSVRGSTGCWWYKERGRVKEYVLDHMPDLVIIGGISHRGDIASIREVIRQIRNFSQADILLMTGAFGQTDPRDEKSWRAINDAGSYGEYRKGLETLADDTNTAFLDMEAAWGGYIRQSGKDLDWFKRDSVHANERGEQILGHILASHLSYPPRKGQSPQDQEIDPLVLDRLNRFQDWKFGFMMHWGIYSQWGCIESWPLVEADKWARPDDLKAWTDRDKDFKWFFRDYVALNTTFNPQRFDPGKWVAAAKDAGMKYVVFTTKHHDGFCMFDTKQTDYRTTDSSCPFHTNPKADVVKAVFDTFRAEGFGIGAYYSKSDWNHEGYWAPDWPHPDRNVNYDTSKYPEKWATFVNFTHNIVEELMTNYGPVDILWLDGGQVRPPRQDINMPKLATMARSHQPGLIVVDRTVGGRYENYVTPEQEVPEKAQPYIWETCMTMATQWSYKANDNYKSTRQLIHLLVNIVAKGGNFLLNVGPDPNGELPELAVQRMKEIGKWMKVNGDAIYGTRPVPPYKVGPVCLTRKASTAYVIHLAEGGQTAPPERIQVPPIRGGKSVRLLGSDTVVEWKANEDGLTITIPQSLRQSPPCEYAWAFEISEATIAAE